MGLPMYEEIMDDEIILNCIVKESPGTIFQVSINEKKSIYKLKKEIKKELSDEFQNIDPIGIKLWSVQLCQNDSRLTQLRNYSASEVDNLGKEAQYSTLEVREYFNTKVRDNIHVIVQGRRISLQQLMNSE